MKLKKRFIKNSFLNVSGWGWLSALAVFTTPYIFHKLGYEQYGILSLVLMVLGYFAFLDFGLGDAVIKFVAHHHTLKEYNKINKIVSSIFMLFIVIGILGGILIFLFAKYWALDIFKIPPELRSKARFCFYIGAFGFFLNLVLSVISKIPEAIQRFDISNAVNIIMGTFTNFANVMVLFFGYGLKELVIVNLLSGFLGIVAFYISVKKVIPGFRILLLFSAQEMRGVFSFGLYTLFTKFSSIFSQSINQLIVGVVLGPAGISVLNIPSKLTSKFQAFIYKIAYAIFPMTSELSAMNDLVKIEEIYLKLSRYIYMVSSLFFIILISYSRSILYFWLGSEFAQKAWLPMVIVSVALYITTLTMVPSLVAVGMGKPKYNAILSFFGAVINIILVYPLTKIFGITGSVLSFLVGCLIGPVFIFVVNKSILNVSNRKYFSGVFGKITILNTCFLILFIYFQKTIIHSLFTFFAVLFISEALMAGFFYFIGLYHEDKQQLDAKLASLFGWKR
jgi:O-antigen/teichoic acid export membrane protein